MKLRRHFEFDAPLATSAGRKLAMGTWRRVAHNPQGYVAFDLDVTRCLAELAARRDADGVAVTLTHVFAAIVGRLQRAHPELRSIIRRGKLYPRKSTSLLLQVAISRDQLSGFVIDAPDTKTPSEIAVEATAAVTRMRASGQDAYGAVTKLFGKLPAFVVGNLLETLGFLFYELNISPTAVGLPDDPYGAMRLNNLGALGIDDAIGPHIPWMHSPGTWVLTRVRDVAVPIGDGFERRSMMKFWCVIDHRLGDGGGLTAVRRLIEEYLADPARLWTPR